VVEETTSGRGSWPASLWAGCADVGSSGWGVLLGGNGQFVGQVKGGGWDVSNGLVVGGKGPGGPGRVWAITGMGGGPSGCSQGGDKKKLLRGRGRGQGRGVPGVGMRSGRQGVGGGQEQARCRGGCWLAGVSNLSRRREGWWG